MVVRKNEPEVWDNLWNGISEAGLRRMFEEDLMSIRWHRISNLINTKLAGFSGLKIVEIGGGTGTYSAIMAQKGAQVTIIDYSVKALEASKAMCRLHNVNGEWLCINALNLPESMYNLYDVSMSYGTAEHFSGNERSQIIQSHINLIRPGGLAIISVPNAWNIPYRIWKYKLEKQGRWDWGEEYPFTRNELKRICMDNNWKVFYFMGDSLIWSLNYLNFLRPSRVIRKCLKLPLPTTYRFPSTRYGTPLDQYLSYSLILVIKK